VGLGSSNLVLGIHGIWQQGVEKSQNDPCLGLIFGSFQCDDHHILSLLSFTPPTPKKSPKPTQVAVGSSEAVLGMHENWQREESCGEIVGQRDLLV